MCVILCIHHLYISGQVEFSLQGRHSFCSMMCCASSAATIPRERLDDERYPTALPPSSCQQLPGGCRRDAIDCSCCELSWKRHRERDDQTTTTSTRNSNSQRGIFLFLCISFAGADQIPHPFACEPLVKRIRRCPEKKTKEKKPPLCHWAKFIQSVQHRVTSKPWFK